jgi:excisionase family DNA binding protein
MSSHAAERFLRIDEVAREARVSQSTVRHWLRTGRLSSTKLGKRRVIPRDAFEAMVTRGTAHSP